MTHNDIKPSNIMVNPKTKEVRIIDFGSATIHSFLKKFKLADIGYTKKYTKLDPSKYYGKKQLMENDFYALSKIKSIYLGSIDVFESNKIAYRFGNQFSFNNFHLMSGIYTYKDNFSISGGFEIEKSKISISYAFNLSNHNLGIPHIFQVKIIIP